MKSERRYQLERGYAEANRELLSMSGDERAGRRDALVGRQSRRGVRHALQALCAARGRGYEDSWSTERLLRHAGPGHALSIGPGILDQYPADGEPCPAHVPNPITIIPDHIFMVTADISMLLEVAQEQAALRAAG